MSAPMKPLKAIIGLVAGLAMGLLFAFTAAPAFADPGYTTSVATISASASTSNGVTTVSVSASDGTFQPGETVDIVIHSQAQQIGTATADSSGAFSTSVEVPKGFTGSHTIEAIGETSGVTASFPIQLAGGATNGAGSGSNGGSVGLGNTGVAVIGIGALGFVLLAGGGLLLMAGRRRQTASQI